MKQRPTWNTPGAWEDGRLAVQGDRRTTWREGRLSIKTLVVVLAVATSVMAVSIGIVVATDDGSTEVRIAAKRLETGRIEFALQQRELDGSWGDRILPSRRFFPASGREGRWLTSSSIELTVPTPTPGPTLTVDEYAEWCGRDSELDAEGMTWAEYGSALDELINDGLGVAPPDVLRDYHEATTQGLASLRLTVSDFDPEAVSEPGELFGQAILYVWWVSAAEDALPDDVRATLEEAGCIETGDEPAEAAPTPTATPVAETPTPTPAPTASIGDVVAVGRLDAVIHGIERNAFTTADGVATTRIDIEFTNTRGAIETINYGHVDGFDAEGWKVDPYEHCHDSWSSPCPEALYFEDLNPGATVRVYIYFVESPVYPLAFIQLWRSTGEYTIERVEPKIAIPAP